MGERDQITVRMRVTRVPEFLPVVQGFVAGLAEQLNFKEGQRLKLKQGIGQACAQLMEASGNSVGQEIEFEFNGFPDRLEIVVESGQGGETVETQAILLNQLLDRVSVEDTPGGGQRLTLVKYNEKGSQP
jgi:anti-sigma regulatory factor (Ser/Thr protein kinase)